MTSSPLRTPDWVNNNGHRPAPAQPADQPCIHCGRIGPIAAATQDALRDIRTGIQEMRDGLAELRTLTAGRTGNRPPVVPGHTRRNGPDDPRLTATELAVLAGMAAGKSNTDIARDLHLSEHTIKSHAKSVFHRIGARDRAHAVAVGYDLGLLTAGASSPDGDMYAPVGGRR